MEPEIPLLFCYMFIPQVLVYIEKEAFIAVLFKIPKYHVLSLELKQSYKYIVIC